MSDMDIFNDLLPAPRTFLEKLSPATWIADRDARRDLRIANVMVKAISANLTNSKDKADAQGSLTNPTFEAYGSYRNAGPRGVREPVGINNKMLRSMYHQCEPAGAIIDTRIRQVVRFSRKPVTRRGYEKQPGFRIRMSDDDAEPTPADKTRMKELTQFILRTGSCLPPIDERPIGYVRGFPAFLGQLTRDTLTLDAVAMLRWSSERKKANGDPAVPIVAFALEDAALIRKVNRPYVAMNNGIAVTEDWKTDRTNTDEPILHVLEQDGQMTRQYTAFDLAYGVRNPRTDRNANGYGYSELEMCINAISLWICARESNQLRFDKDALPRGILALFGNMNEQMFQSFKLQWHQLLQGVKNRWNNPMFRANGEHADIKWLPVDMSPRDMEQHQTMYCVALWMHARYGIHPAETGWDNQSPFRPPLSEGSPEAKLEASQDSGLFPLVHWIQDFINQEIIWVLDPTETYMLEFVGLGQGDEGADVDLRGKYLQFGLTTPRYELRQLDTEIPALLKDDPALDMLGPWAQNRQLLMSMAQADQAAQQATMQQDMVQQQQAAQMGQAQAGAVPGSGAPGDPAAGNIAPGGNDKQQNHEAPDDVDQVIQKALAGAGWI